LEYRASTELYSTAVAELSRRIGISSLDDYLNLHQAAEAARMRSNEARARLEHHITEHHCEFSK
jgi:hypothetical protein